MPLHPIHLLKIWIKQETALGAPYAQHAIFSTQGHGRVVAIRELSEQQLLFFTQKRTRKVTEIKTNSVSSLTFWFELTGRSVNIEGHAIFLSDLQNEQYWKTYPKPAQIRFCSYAPTSGLPIHDKQFLENKRATITKIYQQQSIPVAKDYCGIAIIPTRLVFYTYHLDKLSDVWEYQIHSNNFIKQQRSP